jgi:hypothetical protein
MFKSERYANHILWMAVWRIILTVWDSTRKKIWLGGVVTEHYASLVNDQNYEPRERYNPITGTMDPTFVVSGGRPGSNRRK